MAQPSVREMPKSIAELDLDVVRRVAKKTYPSLSEEDIDQAAIEYRDFLWACKAWTEAGHEERFAGLSLGADRMWHCHMMLPARYHYDCERVFGRGRLLDHDPFFNEADMGEAVRKTEQAYGLIDRPVPTDPIDDCQWGLVILLGML